MNEAELVAGAKRGSMDELATATADKIPVFWTARLPSIEKKPRASTASRCSVSLPYTERTPMSNEVSITVTRQDRYRFLVDFGSGLTPSIADEPPPLGTGTGPSPSQLLLAAMANCMSASLVFANAKFKEDPGTLATTATCTIGRNEHNRPRITGIKVKIALGVNPESLAQLDRALAQFEDFCTVSQSVKIGIPLDVTVTAPDGRVLKS